ncbi:MAG: TolC family protein, partial [Alphaproteobacteria bacterium]|nr:TolC family protein [Alphaproteobacteria bacterium]
MKLSLLFPTLLIGVVFPGTIAEAETLQGALAKAYATNPTLNAARAGQKATDEQIAIARAKALPSASVGFNATKTYESAADAAFSPSRVLTIGPTLNVPLYTGGSTKYGIRAADVRSAQGRAQLKGTELTVFSQVVAAYMDVILNENLVALNAQQVKVLDVNLQATRDRFQVGDLTRTDIAQSESRLAQAKSGYDSAQANLIAARETYVQLVGEAPVALADPPALPNLPKSPDDAVEVALANNPDLIAANKGVDAARYDVSVARAERLPTISGSAAVNYTNYLNSLLSPYPGISFPQTDKNA